MGRFPLSPRRLFPIGLTVLVGLLVAGPGAALLAPTSIGSVHPVTAPLATPPVRAAATTVSTNASWVSLTPSVGPTPLLRAAAALTYDAADGYTLLFGGCNRHLCPLGDTWKYQDGLWTNLTSSLSTSPPAREGAAFAFDPQDGYVLLFGGVGTNNVTLGDTWQYVGGSWTPIANGGGVVPPARAFAQAAYVPTTGAVVLFGGIGANGHPLGDTWTFANGVWTNRTGSYAITPPARAAGVFSYDTTDGYAVLFGGSGAGGAYLGDTWTFGAAGWTNVTGSLPIAPAPRTNTTLSYDASRTVLLLYGGWDGAAMSDTWSFSGGAWRSLTANLSVSPGARYESASTFDMLDGYLLLFGGVIGGGHSATWGLLSPLTTALQSQATLLAPGQAGTFTAAISGGLGPFNVTWQFGDGSPSALGVTVSHTFASAGSYSVSVTVTDSVAETLTAATPVVVRLVPLNVTIHPSVTSGTVGQPLQFTAVASGGVAPFTFAWSAPTGICGVDTGPVLNCTPTAAGTLQVGVTVADSTGQHIGVGLSVAVPGTGTSGSLPVTGTPAGGSARNSDWVILLPLAVALAGALVLGLVMYRAGRRRTKALLATRPHCYAVPAWSETPAEFVDARPETAGDLHRDG